MEPEGSLPYSQELTTSPYTEADQSSRCSHPTSWKYILILFYLCLGFSRGLQTILPINIL